MFKRIEDCIIALFNIFFSYNERTPYYDEKHHIFLFKGSYRQIGSQYATALSMEKNLRRAQKYLRRKDNSSKQKIYFEINKAKYFLKMKFPEMLEMMKGITDAYPKYDLNEVVLLNYCTTLTDWQFFSSCSSIAFSLNGKPIIGQNLDLGRRKGYAVAYIIPDNGNAFLAHVTPGFLWFMSGVNERGLCITGSSVNVESQDDIKGDYFPQVMLYSFILTYASNTDDAYRCLRDLPAQGPLRCGLNFILADKNGLVKNIELAGSTIALNEENTLVYITTNHFRTRQLSQFNRRSNMLSIELEKNSIARYQEAFKWVLGDSLNTDSLRVFLRRKGYFGAWWRLGIPPDLGYTSASYIIDFNTESFEYWVESQKEYCSVSLKVIYNRKLFIN